MLIENKKIVLKICTTTAYCQKHSICRKLQFSRFCDFTVCTKLL